MAEYSPSKIIKDGNTYNFRDDTKIPLAGSNQISGSLIPATDNSIDIGSSAKNIKALYTKGITINGTQFLPSDYIPRSGGAVMSGAQKIKIAKSDNSGELRLDGGTDWGKGASLSCHGKDDTVNAGSFALNTSNGTNSCILMGKPNGTLTWGSKNVAMAEDVIPRSGGAVISGDRLARTDDNNVFNINGGTGSGKGGTIALYGKNSPALVGTVIFQPSLESSLFKNMILHPDGTWTWSGTACQITSDQRFKQQIAQIDDALLTAWEDVNPVQFKYNDAVDQKGNTARLHTGYVVQQIDEACKSHGVDISAYGLYCHEEYAEETREVEQADGTKTTEVVRPASEHYSLRYTEALIVECAYLRKCIKELRTEIEELKSSK